MPQENGVASLYNKLFIDQACLVKMAGYWPHSFFFVHQKNNLANIQPS